MTAWNRPPAQGSAIVTTWAGLRRRSRRPRITIRLGASLLLIALAVLVLALRTNPSRANAAVPVTGDGTRRSVTLRENTQYGLFSDDHNLSCEVTAPSGEALTLSDTTGYSARTSRQVLGFRSARAGTYTVSCTGTGEITVDIADISPEFSRATLLYTCALTTGALGGLLVLAGAGWLLVLRQRPRSALAGPAGPAGSAPSKPRCAPARAHADCRTRRRRRPVAAGSARPLHLAGGTAAGPDQPVRLRPAAAAGHLPAGTATRLRRPTAALDHSRLTGVQAPEALNAARAASPCSGLTGSVRSVSTRTA